ncbi:hypothetical protein [Kitasatospora sp. CB02891]|uniref:hypothetical protein n=1 Tax=Kitasatospora sp. CB02891 TaxID=2020329 RepID=UPI000C27934C|nr:hypothetical protein [Kitasatospora sp. CB02891]PJN22265.1 hypothetical protein CG736_29505 [Kitasatospora sp. CB02891]
MTAPDLPTCCSAPARTAAAAAGAPGTSTTVANDLPARTQDRLSAGFGILGGTFTAGPGPTAGWTVHAELPMPAGGAR